MHFRVLLVLAVATFAASCSSFASAGTRSTEGVDADDSSAIGHLRGQGTVQMEDNLLDLSPSGTESKLKEQAVPEETPAGGGAGRVTLTDAQKAKLRKKLRALSKDDEARAMSLDALLLWGGLVGIVWGGGWLASSRLEHKSPHTNGLPLIAKAPDSS